MKLVKSILALAAFALCANLNAQNFVPDFSYDGDPNGSLSADNGAICRDLSNPYLWIKTGGNNNTGWKSLRMDAVSAAFSGTLVLTSGTGVITNSLFTTNSKVFVTTSGTANPQYYKATMVSGTATIVSGTATTHTANWISFGR